MQTKATKRTTIILLASFILSSSLIFQDVHCRDRNDLAREKCEEASLLDSYATCYPDLGRIYVYDPEVKSFWDARSWCRQKFNGDQDADLIPIETCDAWTKIPTILKPFMPLRIDSRSKEWIWTQVFVGSKGIGKGTPNELIWNNINSNLNTSIPGLQASCLKDLIDTVQGEKRANFLVLLVNGLSITPQLVSDEPSAKGHALCEFRFTPEKNQDPSSSGNSSPEPTTSEPVTTNIPVDTDDNSDEDHHPDDNERNETDSAKRVDDFFDNITSAISVQNRSLTKITARVLKNVQNDDFVLSTSEHIARTVLLTQKLSSKIDTELDKINNKSVAIAERITFTQQVCAILSTLMENKNDKCWQDTEQVKTPIYVNQIIDATDQIGFKLACKLDENRMIPINAESITMEVFAFGDEQFTNQPLAFPTKQSKSSQIKFPSGVNFDVVSSASRCGRPSGIGKIIKKISNYMEPSDEKVDIVSDLVSFSFGSEVTNVNVEVGLTHESVKRRGDSVKCVFWDSDNLIWNSSGCVYDPILSTRRKTVCHCNHLTNFAILMDISGRQEDDQAKSILTLVCLTASVISLILTIFFLITLPPVKSTPITSKRVTITTNLCICLLITDFLIMFGVEHTENILWCRIISGTLFYFLASTFTWMLLEGYLLYQMIVVVPLNFEFRSRWLYLIGYGLALIWLAITISILGTHSLYDDTSYYCWISNPLYPSRIWFFAGPVALIIASNMVIYGKSIQIALMSNIKKKNWAARGTSPDQKSHDSGLVRRWLKGSCSLLILLGLTWTIGFLYLNEFSDWLSYVFIIVNASQGVFIFLFEIVTNAKARPAIIRMISGKFPSTMKSSFSKTSSSNPISTLSTRSSRPFGGKEPSRANATSLSNSLSERKKSTDVKHVMMELK